MVAAKRAAPTQGGRATKKASVDPYDEAINSALALLTDSSLNDSVKQLLINAAPFTLKVPAAERHRYQNELVETLEEVLKSVQVEKEQSVQSTEEANSKNASDMEEQGKNMEEIAAEAASAREAAAAATKAEEAAAAAVHSAKQALKVEAAKEQDIEAEHKKTVEAKQSREALIAETWAKLKAEAAWGKMWRIRDKMIETVLQVLSEMPAAEDSVKQCLPVAMKAKPGERGPFAQQTIEHVEGYLQRSLCELDEKIKGHDGQVEALKTSIAGAQAAVQAASAELEAKQSETINTDNASMEASEKKKAAESLHKELAANEAALRKGLEEARASASAVNTVLARFHAIVKDGAAGAVTEQASEEVATEAVSTATPAKDAGDA
eukprot:TRINITY_DN3945_c0_g1_i1.p1 TRINITY_DN3945_c0_g1~~TRINITY_DN3945_c0_g1_i1.p1  ORF type:complete len:380 (+),score=156.08 TRINITY_DN3945_c0_g1_i1:84-1223(+)